MDDRLRRSVDALIESHGLAAVYNEVRSRPGFCGNCGGVLEDGIQHSYFSMGGCYLDRTGADEQ